MVRAEAGRRPGVVAALSPTTAPPAIVVAGPTGSGKSRLALRLAEAFAGVVINADSLQVYRDLRVLTARPTPDDEARAPHRLYGVLAGDERCSAGRWSQRAATAVGEAWREGRVPIVVGGTGLYLSALLMGLSPIPEVPAAVRAAAAARLEALGREAFLAEIGRLDPRLAAGLHAGDRQRLLRAHEVAVATGRPLSSWQREPPRPPVVARWLTIGLVPPREALYAGLDARFARMVADGALDEVARLLALALPADAPLRKAVGVRELATHLRGETSLEEAMARAMRATRQYAKRQVTWLRHQLPIDHVYHAQYSERLDGEMFSVIRRFLLTDAG